MASRPLVKVQGGDGGSVALPAIFNSPVRPDIVQFVHTNMAKNRRQPYAVSLGAGHQHSAESWGTGRAVSRIPRVSGGGNSRSGQAAFGNMCRKGRMFNPTRVWRKWHRKINTNQKRYAVASAIAASQSLSLVQARGHKVDKVPELPLVVDNSWESIQKTKDAYQALASVGADQDVDKSRKSRKLRRGAGKMRGRRWVQRRGPLLIYKNDNGLKKAFRGLSGIDLCQVSSLNLLQLAPGGHLGRFIIWTQSAFEALNEEWGTANASGSVRKGYTLPRPLMTISDLARIINSDEIQSKVKAAQLKSVRPMRKKNPLKNFGVRVRLNPYATVLRRAELLRTANSGKESKEAGSKRAKYQQAKEQHSKRQKLNWERLADDGLPEVADEVGGSDASDATGPRPKMEHAHDWSKYQSFDDDDCNGKNAPSLDSLQFLNDEKLDLSKPTVLLFFAKYHKPGYNMLPKYNELASKYSGINFVGAAIDPAKADVEKFMTADKYAAFRPAFPVAWDEKKTVRDAFQVCLMDTLNVVHAFILVGGKIVWHQDHSMVGATVPTYVDEVDAQLAQLSAGKPLFSFGNGPADSDEESSDESEEEDEEESDEDEDEE